MCNIGLKLTKEKAIILKRAFEMISCVQYMSSILLYFTATGLQMGADWYLANRITHQFTVMEPRRNSPSHWWGNSAALASACCFDGG
jgi:hypothetical protein